MNIVLVQQKVVTLTRIGVVCAVYVLPKNVNARVGRVRTRCCKSEEIRDGVVHLLAMRVGQVSE